MPWLAQERLAAGDADSGPGGEQSLQRDRLSYDLELAAQNLEQRLLHQRQAVALLHLVAQQVAGESEDEHPALQAERPGGVQQRLCARVTLPDRAQNLSPMVQDRLEGDAARPAGRSSPGFGPTTTRPR